MNSEPDAVGIKVDQDFALVQQIRAGHPELFHELVRRHERAVYRTALAILHNPEDAEDVTQETFLRAVQHLDQFRGDARFSTWLTQIAVNTARMKLRKNHAHLWESLDEPVQTDEGSVSRDVAEWRENPEQQYTREERQGLLMQALKGMHPSYRSVLVLRDLQHLSTEETAQALGLSVANVKTRLLRARLQLRERLAPHFRQEKKEQQP